MARTFIGAPSECNRIEALKLTDAINLKVPERFGFGTMISKDKTLSESSDLRNHDMIVDGTLRAETATIGTRGRSLRLPNLVAGHANLRISEKGDIVVGSFPGTNASGEEGSLTAAAEKGNIKVSKAEASRLKLEVENQGDIYTGPTDVDTARLITVIGGIRTDGLRSRLTLRCATDDGDVKGEFGFPLEGGSLQTLQGLIDIGIVGDSCAGGTFKVTNHRGNTKIRLVPSISATGALEYFQGTLEVTCPWGNIDLNRKPKSGYARIVFGEGSVIQHRLIYKLTAQ
jgi:hypothetical protein